jgi:hypothetical protein
MTQTSTESTEHHSHNPLHHKKHDETTETSDSTDQGNTDDKYDNKTAKGPDPALVGSPAGSGEQTKLTGDGAPGSHSAYFGLTPDGRAVKETNSKTTAPVAAHSDESAVGGGKESSEGDSGSRAPAGNEQVSDQMKREDQSGVGADTSAGAPLKGSNDEKPGAGATGLSQ